MSREIDERVVSMKFDNAQFEKGCKQTQTTLEKLKTALNFKDAGKGIDTVNKSISGVNFNPMMSGIESVNAKFSMMGAIGFEVMRRITDAVIDMGGKIAATAAQIEGMKDGFSEYELQMNSIQTIMANTKKYGTTLQEVKDTLNELNDYADKTVYKFSDMTNAIGKFTTAGLSLESSTKAIKGLSNYAASVSADNTTLARVEYQISQALAAGKFQLMDWRSLENANMAGGTMVETLKDIAREHGIAIDQMIAKEGSFRQTLSEKADGGGWLTTDIFMEALERFSNDPTMEDAATKVRTFSKMMDTLKESIGTGWAQSWQLLIGDFEEATAVFTRMTAFFNRFIEGATKARNAILGDFVKEGGRNWGLAGLYTMMTNVMEITNEFKKGFREIFPATTGSTLAAITKNFYLFAQSLKPTADRMEGIRTAGRNLGTVLKALLTILDSLNTLFKPILNGLKIVLVAAISLASALLEKLIPAVRGFTQAALPIVAILAAIATAIALLPIIAIGAAFLGLATAVKYVAKNFGSFMEYIQNSAPFKAVAGFIDDIIKKLQDGQNIFMAVIGSVESRISQLRSMMEESAKDEKGPLHYFLKEIDEFISRMPVIGTAYTFMKKVAKGLWMALSSIGSGLKKFVDTLSAPQAALLVVALTFTIVAHKLYTACMSLASITKVTFDALGGALGGVKNVLNEYKKVVKSQLWVNFAYVIAMIAGSLAILSQCDQGKVRDAAISIGILVAALYGGLAAIEYLVNKTSSIGSLDLAKNMFTLALAMGSLAAAAGILTFAFIALAKTEMGIWEFLRAVGALASMVTILMGSLTAMSIFLTKFGATVAFIAPQTSIFIIAFAAAVTIMVNAFTKLATVIDNMSISKFSMVESSFKGIMLTLAALTALTSFFKNSGGAGLGILGFAASAFLIIETIQEIQEMIESKKNYAGAITAVGLMMAFLMAYAKLLQVVMWNGNVYQTARIKDLALSVLTLTGCAYLMVGLVDQIKKLNASHDDMWKFAEFIGSVGGIFALLLWASKFSSGVKGFAACMMSFAASMFILEKVLEGMTNYFADAQANGKVGALQNAFRAIIMLGIFMSALMHLAAPTAGAAATVFAIGTVMGILVALFTVISVMEWDQILKGIVGLGGCCGALSLVFLGLSKITTANKLDAMGLVSFIAILSAITGSLIAISHFGGDSDKIFAAAIGMVGCLVALGHVSKVLTKFGHVGPGKTKNIVLLAVALIPISAALTALSRWGGSADRILASMVAIGALFAELMYVGQQINNMPTLDTKKALAVVVLSSTLAVAAASLTLLSRFGGSADRILASMVAIGALVMEMGYIAKLITNEVILDVGQVGAFLAVSLVLVEAAFALSMLANFEPGNVIASAFGLAIVVGTLAGILAVAQNLQLSGAGALLLASVSLIPAAFSLAMLAKIPWPELQNAMIALLATCTVLSLVVNICNESLTGAASMVVISLACVIMANAFKQLATVPFDSLIGPLIAMGGAFIILGAASVALGALIGLAAPGAAIIIVLALAFSIFANSMSQVMDSAVPVLQVLSQLFEAIGSSADIFASAMERLGNIQIDFSFLEVFKQAVSTVDISTTMQELGTKITTAINSMDLAIKAAWTSLALQIAATANTEFYNMGKGAGESAAKGLQDTLTANYTAGFNVAKQAGAGYSDGIQDPNFFSTWFNNMGSGAGLSSALGLMKTAPDNYKAGEKVAASAGAGYSDKVQSLADDPTMVNSWDKPVEKAVDGAVDKTKEQIDAKAPEIATSAQSAAQWLGSPEVLAAFEQMGVKDAGAYLSKLSSMISSGTAGMGLGDIGGLVGGGTSGNGSGKNGSSTKKWKYGALDVYDKKLGRIRSEKLGYHTEDEYAAATAAAKADEMLDLDGLSKKLEQATQNTDDLTGAIGDLDKAGKGAGGSGGGLKEEKDALESLSETIENQMNLFEEFKLETDLTKDQLLSNMRSQIDGVMNWSKKLSELAFKGVNQGLLDKLAQLGPQGYKYVNAFSQMTTEELIEANKLFDQSLRLPESSANQIGLSFNMAGQLATKGYVNGLDPNAGGEIAKAMGKHTLDELATALQADQDHSKAMEEIGWGAGKGFMMGLEAKRKLATDKAKQIGTESVGEDKKSGIKKDVNFDSWKDIGYYAVSGLTKGVSENGDKPVKATEKVGKAMNKKLKDTLKEKSPSKFTRLCGSNYMEGMRLGVIDKAKEAVNSVTDVGNSLASAILNTTGWSEIGENAIYNLTDGVRKSSEYAVDQTENSGFDIVNSMNGIMTSIMDALNGEINPVISPYLDLTDVNRKAGIINSMFDTRRFQASLAVAGAGGDTQTAPTTYNFTINSTAMDPRSLAKEIERIIIRR